VGSALPFPVSLTANPPKQASEAYLPLVLSLLEFVDATRNVGPVWKWSSGLAKKSKVMDLQYSKAEHIMVLMLIGIAHCNVAYDAVADGERQLDYDAKLNIAADALRKAAGVFEATQRVAASFVNLPADRPLEVINPIVQALFQLSSPRGKKLNRQNNVSAESDRTAAFPSFLFFFFFFFLSSLSSSVSAWQKRRTWQQRK
jgi:hypothetical protein